MLAEPSSLFVPEAVYPKQETKAVLLLEPGELPTTFFYALPRIPNALKKRTRRFRSLHAPPRGFALEKGTWVIIVRHASRAWLKKLQAHAPLLSRVTYLHDDDIPAILKARELPFYYALRTWWRYRTTQSLLKKVVSEVALSTQKLIDRYPHVPARLWEPRFPPQIISRSRAAQQCVYFYHATLTHRQEIKWLLPVVQKVQTLVPEACFELLGDTSLHFLFKNISRVRLLPAMKWPAYHDYLGTLNYAVGLAPLLDTSFNRARAHTKLYQITRAGAAGIFSDLPPYSKKIIHGRCGILCCNDQDRWIQAIVALLQNKDQRDILHHHAAAWMNASSKNE